MPGRCDRMAELLESLVELDQVVKSRPLAEAQAYTSRRPPDQEQKSAMSQIEFVRAREITRFARQSHGRGRCPPGERRHRSGRGARRAPPPARARRWSCATAIRRAISARACAQAVANVNGEIRDALLGLDGRDQAALDQRLIDLDGTDEQGAARRERHAGRLAGSGAAAAAAERNLPLFRTPGGRRHAYMPVPMMNIINGGAHADNSVDIQEFMILPVGATTLQRSAAPRRRDLSCAEGRAEKPGSEYGGG